jgi:hypothetical protein
MLEASLSTGQTPHAIHWMAASGTTDEPAPVTVDLH